MTANRKKRVGDFQYKKTIKLSELKIEPLEGSTFALILDNGRKQVQFMAPTMGEAGSWIDEISKAINELQENTSSLKPGLEEDRDRKKDELISLFPDIPTPDFGNPGKIEGSTQRERNPHPPVRRALRGLDGSARAHQTGHSRIGCEDGSGSHPSPDQAPAAPRHLREGLRPPQADIPNPHRP